ncbi:MAG: hypothetical protein JOY75_13590 [Hyphomicrobiales bacterium]|jgi:hypothetical protein|nr:hypothetical protein [Hyphomicrobiales bacterium]
MWQIASATASACDRRRIAYYRLLWAIGWRRNGGQYRPSSGLDAFKKRLITAE